MMRYTYEEHLKPIVEGSVDVPNFEPMEPRLLLQNIASGGHSMEPVWGSAKIGRHKQWAQFFLTGAGMGSPPHTYGGAGYVIAYPDKFGTFAICKHQFELGAGANPRRGWNPGRCSLCGVDMSINSGD